MGKILIVRPPSVLFDKEKYVRDLDLPFMLKYLEAIISSKGNCVVKLLDCIAEGIGFEELVEITNSFSPDFLIIFTLFQDRDSIFEYAHRVKKERKIKIIAVGPDSTANPEKYIFASSPFDFSVMGECEFFLPELLETLMQGIDKKIRNVYSCDYKDNSALEFGNVDDLPFPIYKKHELQKYYLSYPVRVYKMISWGHILSGRGCRHSCIFCSPLVRQTYGSKLRLRSSDSVVREIKYLLGIGVDAISFCDDNFSSSSEHIRAICSSIIEEKLSVPWSAQVRIDEVDTELLKLMRKAGCIHIRFGIEAGSSRILKKLCKTDDPQAWFKLAKDVFGTCRRIGIDTVALFILGSPTETKEDFKKTYRLAKELNPDFVQLHYFTPYPGSKFYSENKIEIEKIVYQNKPFHYREPTITYCNVESEILAKELNKFYKDFYLRPGYILSNLYKFGLFYLNNPKTFLRLLRQLIRISN